MGLPTPGKATLYVEVTGIWNKAMVLADRGMAQSAQGADDLLRLCAWHSYPDLHAIGLKATAVQFGGQGRALDNRTRERWK